MHQEQIDKATPRPWHIVQGGNFTCIGAADFESVCKTTGYLGHAVCTMGDWDGEKHDCNAAHTQANAALIVTAVNEHALLCAVAEAAEAASLSGWSFPHLQSIIDSIKALKALRKSGGE